MIVIYLQDGTGSQQAPTDWSRKMNCIKGKHSIGQVFYINKYINKFNFKQLLQIKNIKNRDTPS